MTSTDSTSTLRRPVAEARRERRAISYCDIWDMVAPGEQCPACRNTFQDRLRRAAARG